ncbi:MAG: LCP family protein [Clostridiaceae bacterium]|nr:LCP family protein [Clostridiaceae bacterium]
MKKKGIIILYIIIAVGAGILTGLFISSVVSADNTPIMSDISTGGDINNSGNGVEEGGGKVREEGANYNITDNQRYYKPLVSDSDRNVLLIGEDAYSGNYDTIIIASISEKNKKIQLFNFPRDIYIDYSEEILNRLKEKSPALYNAKGFQKINAAHTVGARIEYKKGTGRFGDSNFDFLADLIEEVFGITVHDYAYVNTKGFREIVDLFGGVKIYVPVRMKYDDPVQNLHIDIEKGMQHLNGEQAEGFVRFRQGYDENGVFKNYSDQFRKENQNEFLKEFFKQHVNIKNLGKIDDLAELLNKNILTSIDDTKKISSYVSLLGKALTGNYTQESSIVECEDTKKINGVYFDIIRTR